jgi:hypothetical protein
LPRGKGRNAWRAGRPDRASYFGRESAGKNCRKPSQFELPGIPRLDGGMPALTSSACGGLKAE